MAMDARPKLLRYQTLNPGVGSGRDVDAWPYLPTLLPRFAGHSSECLILYRSPYVCGVSRSSHVLFAAYHKARPSRAINEDVYYYYYYAASPVSTGVMVKFRVSRTLQKGKIDASNP